MPACVPVRLPHTTIEAMPSLVKAHSISAYATDRTNLCAVNASAYTILVTGPALLEDIDGGNYQMHATPIAQDKNSSLSHSSRKAPLDLLTSTTSAKIFHASHKHRGYLYSFFFPFLKKPGVEKLFYPSTSLIPKL